MFVLSFRANTISLHLKSYCLTQKKAIMNVFKLEIDCARCYWVGMALVAAVSYDAAVNEYVKSGESGDFVKSGEIVFTSDSKKPIEGLVSENEGVLCDVVTYDA